MKIKVPHKILLQLCILLTFGFVDLHANNIQVVSPLLVNKNTTQGTVYIQCDVFWEHSWRRNMNANWDAAWVFAKCYNKDVGEWSPIYFDTLASNHNIGSSNVPMTIEVAKQNIDGATQSPGVFIYRAQDGHGPNEIRDLHLKWNYRAYGYTNQDTITVSVFAIEMVYIPQGKFTIGDGSSENTLYNIGGILKVGKGFVQNVDAIDSNTALFFNAISIPNVFPRGYNAFYLMKYEITQHAYVDFLNTLTLEQQAARTASSPQAGTGTFALVPPTHASNPAQYRNFIKIRIPGTSSGVREYSALYGHSIDNVTWSREDAGGNIACNFLTWMDGIAYSDWAGLRPYTELEYEKACRGHKSMRSGEYAWANKLKASVLAVHGFKNANLSNEESNTVGANYLETGKAPWVMRVGAFAKDSTSRFESGAGYYGVMELSGNLWERCINISTPEGRAFQAINGDGAIELDGSASVYTWPSTGLGAGYRGFEVSNRKYADYVNDSRRPECGFRACRKQ
ncbi:MAG: SUMF1/EgtB/PvdO family nonheme iron enzyme [Bacteroidales bacterium]